MTEDETSGQKDFGQVTETEFVAQPPQNNLENEVGGKLQSIKGRKGPLVKEFEAVMTPVTFVAVFSKDFAFNSTTGGTMWAVHL